VFAHFNLGLAGIKTRQFDKAIDELNKALISDPTRFDIYKYLSNCYNQVGNYSRALRAAEKYLEKSLLAQAQKFLSGNQNEARYQQIRDYLRDNEYERAVSLARLLFQFEERDAYSLFIGVGMKIVQDQVAASNPNLPTPEYLLKCTNLATKLIAKPTPENYLWQAKIYEKVKQFDKAAQEIEEYLRIQPEDDELRHSLMMIYVNLNDLVRAHKVMGELVVRNPNNWKYLITYARLMAALNGPWEQIVPYIQRSIQIGGDEARKLIAENQPGNLLLPNLIKDPGMRDLLGSFFPANEAVPSQTGETPSSQPGIRHPLNRSIQYRRNRWKSHNRRRRKNCWLTYPN